MSSTLNFGARSLILNETGSCVGTIMYSPKTLKWVYCQFVGGDKVTIQTMGDETWKLTQEKNPHWVLVPSYLVVKCTLSDDRKTVEIELVHNHLPEWNAIYEVAFEVGWSEKFKASFADYKSARARAGMETHIANYRDLTV
jgi:hypothetical protein